MSKRHPPIDAERLLSEPIPTAIVRALYDRKSSSKCTYLLRAKERSAHSIWFIVGHGYEHGDALRFAIGFCTHLGAFDGQIAAHPFGLRKRERNALLNVPLCMSTATSRFVDAVGGVQPTHILVARGVAVGTGWMHDGGAISIVLKAGEELTKAQNDIFAVPLGMMIESVRLQCK